MSQFASAQEELINKIKYAKELIIKCNSISEIPGKRKFLREINAELSFLNKLRNSNYFNPDHVKSSNLSHLDAVFKCYSEVSGVVKILAPFTCHPNFEMSTGILSSEDTEATKIIYCLKHHSDYPPIKRVTIDVVCDYGKTWIKVIARNPSALILSSTDARKYGQRTIVEQVQEILQCAKQNEYMFKPPEVKIRFSCGYNKELYDLLADVPAQILFCDDTVSSILPGNYLKTTACDSSSDDKALLDVENNDTPYHNLSVNTIPRDSVLNLDVSSMIAHVSNMTNGRASAKFNDGILNEQAKRELISPVRDIFKDLFEGHKCICCNAAYRDFDAIVSVVGGPEEKKRAQTFLEQITVVPDDPSDRTMNMQTSSKIKCRSKIIFGTGDKLQAVTLTANSGFLRAAQGQGLNFVALSHESRALSEMKELKD